MTLVSVRAAAEHLARVGSITPHQLAALGRLDERLKEHPDTLQEFTEGWRAQGSPAAPAPQPQNELANLQHWLTFLTGPDVSRLSRNKISQLTVAEACGFIGCVIVETGRPLLDRLDVVGAGSGDGRGAMQYTGVRRTAYDKARSAAIANGLDPGSNSWQQLYFAEEYAGLHDPQQGSLIGWTRVFEDRPGGMDAARAAAYFSEVYFRPGVPRLDRRQAEARRVWGLVKSGQLTAAGRPPVQLQQSSGYGNPLQVPWYAQMDSADREQAARMCFSSSCAMLLQYLRPGTLKGANGDDQYLKRVLSYGDTVDPTAQIRALSSFGVRAKFTKVAGWHQLEQQINAGVPVPCGFLHRGPVSAPSGGGHWLIVVGYDRESLIVHDPFGMADLVSGATLGGVARFAKYSRRNFGPRWMVEGANTGWAITAER
jgi:hypothetical protein